MHVQGEIRVELEAGAGRLAGVAVQHQAARLRAEHQVEIAVGIDVHEVGDAATTGVDITVLVALENETGLSRAAFVPVEIEVAGRLADEQIEVAVAIDVAERRRCVAPARHPR